MSVYSTVARRLLCSSSSTFRILLIAIALAALSAPATATGQTGFEGLESRMSDSGDRLFRINGDVFALAREDQVLRSTANNLLGITQPVYRELDHLGDMLALYELTSMDGPATAILVLAFQDAERRVKLGVFEAYLADKEASKIFTPRAVQAIEDRILAELNTVIQLYRDAVGFLER